jgi:hypothetical protein
MNETGNPGLVPRYQADFPSQLHTVSKCVSYKWARHSAGSGAQFSITPRHLKNADVGQPASASTSADGTLEGPRPSSSE